MPLSHAAIQRPSQPSISILLIFSDLGRLPDPHAAKVGTARIRITHPLHDCQLSFVVQLLGRAHARMQADVIVDPVESGGVESQLVAISPIAVVAMRHDGVEAVVTAIQLNHHQALRRSALPEAQAASPMVRARDSKSSGAAAVRS